MDKNVFVGVDSIKLIAKAGVDFPVVVEAAVAFAKKETHLPTSPKVLFDFGSHTFEVDEHTNVTSFTKYGKMLMKSHSAN